MNNDPQNLTPYSSASSVGGKKVKLKAVSDGKDALSPQVLSDLRDGSHEAFRTIYLHFANPLLRFLTKLMGSPDDGEEILQSVFMKLWENREKIDPARNFKSYLFTMSRNAAFDLLKERNRFAEIPEGYEQSAGDSFIADEKMIASDTKLMVDIAVSNMPKSRQEVFMLHQQGFSYEEIAERLNITLGNARMHITRARKDVRNMIYLLALFFMS